LLKHALFVFLIWIGVYYYYLLIDQQLLIYVLIPILFTIIFLIQTSKYHTITYILISTGFLITNLIQNIVNFNHEVISSLTLISFVISILYIICYSIFIFLFIRIVKKELLLQFVQQPRKKTIYYLMRLKEHKKDYPKLRYNGRIMCSSSKKTKTNSRLLELVFVFCYLIPLCFGVNSGVLNFAASRISLTESSFCFFLDFPYR